MRNSLSDARKNIPHARDTLPGPVLFATRRGGSQVEPFFLAIHRPANAMRKGCACEPYEDSGREDSVAKGV